MNHVTCLKLTNFGFHSSRLLSVALGTTDYVGGCRVESSEDDQNSDSSTSQSKVCHKLELVISGWEVGSRCFYISILYFRVSNILFI